MADAGKTNPPPENAAAPKPEEMNVEFGSLQTFQQSSWTDFSYGRAKQSTNGTYSIRNKSDAVPLDKLIEMRRRDGQTRALLRLFMLPILSCLNEAEWVAPEYAEDADAEVKFANQMFRLPPTAGGMSSSLDTIMRYTLLSLLEGFSAFEEVRYIPEKGPLKGKITLRKLAHRDSSTVTFKVDDHGGFAGISQTFRDLEGEQKTVDIERDKVWYYTANSEENPYYGVSMFETAWYHYDIKIKLYYIAHIAAQFAAVPGRIGYYPLSATQPQRTAFTQALANFAFNTSMTAPADWKVEPFNGSSGFNFIELIDHHAHMQSKSVLMQFSDTEDRMVLIDNGKADASADMYIKALESIMSQIAESWSTHLMPKYIDWNFGTDVYPKFKFGQLSDAARDSIKDVFTTVVTSSVLNSTPEFVRELEKKLSARLGLDVNYEEIEKHEEEAAEMQAEQQALQEELMALQGGDPNADPAAAGAAPNPERPQMPGAAPVAMSAGEADEALTNLYEMAQNLYLSRPQSGVLGVDDAIGVEPDADDEK